MLGRQAVGLYSNLHVLYANLDMHRWLSPLLLLGWMACLSHEKPATKLFHVKEQGKGQRRGAGTLFYYFSGTIST